MKTLLLIACLLNGSQLLFGQMIEYTKFESKYHEIAWKKGDQASINYIDRQIARGRLDQSELWQAYFIKARKYLDYPSWRDPLRYHENNNEVDHDPSKGGLNWIDSSLHYAALLYTTADTEFLFEYQYINRLYNPLCNKIISYQVVKDQDTLRLNARRAKIYTLKRIFPGQEPINQLGLDIEKTRIDYLLGELDDLEYSDLLRRIMEFQINEYYLRYNEAKMYTDYATPFGYGNIQLALNALITTFFDHKDLRGPDLMNSLSDKRHNLERINTEYQAFWWLNSVSYWDNSKKRLRQSTTNNSFYDNSVGIIDLRDSALFRRSCFSFDYEIGISFDIPTWDTLIIEKVKTDGYAPVELKEILYLSGNGDTSIQIRIFQGLPWANNTKDFNFRVEIISNRGTKQFELHGSVIGQSENTKESKEDETFRFYNNKSDEYGWYKNGVIEIALAKEYGTDTIKIYRYPENTRAICTFFPGGFNAPLELLEPFETPSDSFVYFQLLMETESHFLVVYNNFNRSDGLGWIKKSDFDTTITTLNEIIRKMDYSTYFGSGSAVELRNPHERIRCANCEFYGDRTACSVFKFVKLDPRYSHEMKVIPCGNCTNSKLLQSKSASLHWHSNFNVTVRRVK